MLRFQKVNLHLHLNKPVLYFVNKESKVFIEAFGHQLLEMYQDGAFTSAAMNGSSIWDRTRSRNKMPLRVKREEESFFGDSMRVELPEL